ncbi:MAG: ABC transporter permease subunit/CPBP intramembrane protease [Planctomycetota bacterium]
MNFTNVRLILAREVRDQMRDRRTLFMIFVLPILLYPLLGTAYFQMVQFQTQNSMTVLVVGSGQLASTSTPLIEDAAFSPQLFFDGSRGTELLKLELAPEGPPSGSDTAGDWAAEANRLVQTKKFDAALVFPPDFAKRVEAYRKAIHVAASRPPSPPASLSGGGGSSVEIPRPKIIYTTANERSLMACNRLTAVLDRWTEHVGKTNLIAGGMPAQAVRPFEVDHSNLAGESANKSANLWSRMLPVMLLLWAMTGAFYPAVDLCAGEKERGTLETLLSSPAERSEIVLGKLLTVMAFSMVTSALNLVSVGVTGCLIFRQMQDFGGPPAWAVLWLSLALVPVSALFSALCLALASFARSTKEGQYYLMPLLMLSLPMAVLPMSPGVELNLGNSLIPISGLVLLLKTLLEGSYMQALQFLPVVLAVTTVACWMAIRWAVEQFNKESVIFRESERFAVGLWMRHLMRDRDPTPSAAEGLFCGILILVLSFVFRSSIAPPTGFDGFARVTVVLQLAAILTPALVMAVILTSSPRQTLLLRLPRWKMIPAAAVLALAMHPFILALNSLVMHLYPIAPEMKRLIDDLQTKFASADLGLLILCVAAVPAVCEELAFRGFILSGCRNLGNNWRAILVSAILFGAAHGLLQQSINACVLGIVLGYLAVRSGSLLPGVAFHFLHNAMTVLIAKITPELIDRFPLLGFLVQPSGEGPAYQWPVYLFGGVTSLALLGWFTWFPEARSPEDVLQKVFEQSTEDSLSDAEAARG